MFFSKHPRFAIAPPFRGGSPRAAAMVLGAVIVASVAMAPPARAADGAGASAQALFEAAAAGDLDGVRKLLGSGVDPIAVDEDGVTPLYDAVLRGHLKVAEALLEGGALIDGQTSDLGTPLVLAAHVGNVEAVRFLIERGADVKRANAQGTTTLHVEAGWTDRPEIIDLLVKGGADVDARDDKGATPLFSAVLFGNLANAERLVTAGADVNAQDTKGRTPLHVAAKIGSERFVGYLLSRGAAVDVESKDGRTPLMSAVIFDNQATADLLISKGADRRRIEGLDKSDYASKQVVAAYRNLVRGQRMMRDAVIARLRSLYHRGGKATP